MAGKLNSMDNYRLITHANILSKTLERVLLTRLEIFVVTTDNQFGCRWKHGTDVYIYALEEVDAKYGSQISAVFMCFIDASKAFDKMNYGNLFLS